MKNVKIKCPTCRTEVVAIQYPGAKKIQGYCDGCGKNITTKLTKGCGIPLLMDGGKKDEG